MRYVHIFLLLMFVSYTSCKERNKDSKSKDATASYVPNRIIPVAGEKYVIDIKESVVTWKGSMQLALKGGHTGYIQISTGELLIEKGQLVGGVVDVDMNTIADERHDSDNGLVTHLKSPDFFDAKIFPSSTFAITRVAPAGENITVTGDLMIKGIAHAVTFPVKIEVKSGIVHANGKLIIDRTQWGVRYKSGQFFNNLADETISDDIEFDIKIVAKK